ncbi:MAG: DMT family protein, partial [Bilophila wadsworthia]
MNLPVPVPVATIVLLILSNVFMTFAWYGHLRYKA